MTCPDGLTERNNGARVDGWCQYEVGIAPQQFNPETSVIGESSHNVSVRTPAARPHEAPTACVCVWAHSCGS
jgi:hypothetical protein